MFCIHREQRHYYSQIISERNHIRLTLNWEDLNLAEAEIFLLLPFIFDVDKLSSVTSSIVTQEHGSGLTEIALQVKHNSSLHDRILFPRLTYVYNIYVIQVFSDVLNGSCYLEFWAGFVQSFISLEELNDEDCEVLEAVRVDWDWDGLHSGLCTKLNLGKYKLFTNNNILHIYFILLLIRR